MYADKILSLSPMCAGLGWLGGSTVKPHPRQNPWVIVFVVGGVTPSEIRKLEILKNFDFSPEKKSDFFLYGPSLSWGKAVVAVPLIKHFLRIKKYILTMCL